MTAALDPYLAELSPPANPFLPVLLLLALEALRRRAPEGGPDPKRTAEVLGGLTAAFFLLYKLAETNASADEWLARLETPFSAVFLVVVLPAMHLRGRARRWFAVVPAAALVLAAGAVADGYASVPEGESGFYGLLMEPAWCIAGVASVLVLLAPALPLPWLRWTVRAVCFVLLVWGGVLFRSGYEDYRRMTRFREREKSFADLSETSPVMQSEDKLAYLPAAPCRFTANGGYVQGCNIELAQRGMQIDAGAAAGGDISAMSDAAAVVAAVLTLCLLAFCTGRLSCGWICPLAAMGDVFDWIRRTLALPHHKPNARLKGVVFGVGVGLLAAGLLMSKAVPALDGDGRYLGLKLPEYPFCKICPSQQLAPVAAAGPSAWPPLPTTDWGGGFFLVGCIVLVVVFLVFFATSRRLWCRLCPMGFLGGVFNRGGLARLRKDALRCNGCGVCAEVCPADIDVVRSDMESEDVTCYDCLLCGRCVESCPRDRCLHMEHAGAPVATSRFERHARDPDPETSA